LARTSEGEKKKKRKKKEREGEKKKCLGQLKFGFAAVPVKDWYCIIK